MTFTYKVDLLLRTQTAHCSCTSPQQIHSILERNSPLKLLHYTHPGILTVIHVFQWKRHFQGHSVQRVTVVAT